MSLTELKSCLEELQSFLKARKLPLQAADVCGEWEPENGGAGVRPDTIMRIMSCLKS